MAKPKEEEIDIEKLSDEQIGKIAARIEAKKLADQKAARAANSMKEVSDEDEKDVRKKQNEKIKRVRLVDTLTQNPTLTRTLEKAAASGDKSAAAK